MFWNISSDSLGISAQQVQFTVIDCVSACHDQCCAHLLVVQFTIIDCVSACHDQGCAHLVQFTITDCVSACHDQCTGSRAVQCFWTSVSMS